MKELDLLLESFIAANAQALDEGAFPAMDSFLGTEDDLLWDWMQGTQNPHKDEFCELVRLIRNAQPD